MFRSLEKITVAVITPVATVMSCFDESAARSMADLRQSGGAGLPPDCPCPDEPGGGGGGPGGGGGGGTTVVTMGAVDSYELGAEWNEIGELLTQPRDRFANTIECDFIRGRRFLFVNFEDAIHQYRSIRFKLTPVFLQASFRE